MDFNTIFNTIFRKEEQHEEEQPKVYTDPLMLPPATEAFQQLLTNWENLVAEHGLEPIGFWGASVLCARFGLGLKETQDALDESHSRGMIRHKANEKPAVGPVTIPDYLPWGESIAISQIREWRDATREKGAPDPTEQQVRELATRSYLPYQQIADWVEPSNKRP